MTLKALAIYLPQFHPVPENDAWWGRGFTEWTNVAKARPRFAGHTQPHLPSDLGFYDLRLAETRAAQAEMAREAGLSGFCYYHYWFSGQTILERPFQEVLASGEPDFPFCLCWANENWTRRWDGADHHVLMKQDYSDADDRAHLQHLAPAFADRRYIRVGGKPVFLVYRSNEFPDPKRTTDAWRDEAHRLGIGELHLVRVEAFAGTVRPEDHGFDAAAEFAPDWSCVGPPQRSVAAYRRAVHIASRLGVTLPSYTGDSVYSYDALADAMEAKSDPGYVRYRCVTPGWDNSPRRASGATIFAGATPQRYERWLEAAVQGARACGDDLLFINAWNEWAEGNHLEPDHRSGHTYLDATARVLKSA